MAEKSIGLIISSMDSETTIELYRGIRDEALKYNYTTQGFVIYPSTSSTDKYNEGEFFIFETIDFTKYDGLVIAMNTISDIHIRMKLLNRIKKATIPMISIDYDIDGTYLINNDNYQIERHLFDQLIDKYHCQKINYISGPSDNTESNERLQAYLDGMQEYGFSTKGRVYEGSFYVHDGKNAVQFFKEQEQGRDYDAIMCGNDMMAISTYVELEKQGIAVPDEVLITGYDMIKEVKSMPIISIERDNYGLGKMAIDSLYKLWNGVSIPTRQFCPAYLSSEPSPLDSNHAEKKVWERNTFVAQKHLHVLTRTFVEDSTQCQSFHDYLEVLKKFIANLDPQFFQFVVLGEFAELFDIQDFPTIIIDNADGTRLEMINALIYENGSFHNVEFQAMTDYFETLQKDLALDSDLFWKSMVKMIPSRQSLNTPLHFLERKFGFVSFSGSEFPLMERAYWDWIVTLNYTLNNMFNLMLSKDQYMTDPLTGIYNRLGFHYYSDKLQKRSFQKKEDVFVLFCDLNKLKYINDHFGHEGGDVAIQTVSKAMKEYVSPKLKAFRYGGDEFLILGHGFSENEVISMMESLEVKITQMGKDQDLPFPVSASIGYSIRPWDSEEKLDEFIHIADSMMYEKKQKTR